MSGEALDKFIKDVTGGIVVILQQKVPKPPFSGAFYLFRNPQHFNVLPRLPQSPVPKEGVQSLLRVGCLLVYLSLDYRHPRFWVQLEFLRGTK